jgi:hypothetical protein
METEERPFLAGQVSGAIKPGSVKPAKEIMDEMMEEVRDATIQVTPDYPVAQAAKILTKGPEFVTQAKL